MANVERPAAGASDAIRIRGARQHNLKNVSLDLPRDRFIVITGVSGGSFTALAYGYLGETMFDEFEPTFLKHDVQGDLLRRTLNPMNWSALASSGWGRSEMAADLYDELLFHGARGLPDEERQLAVYKRILEWASGRPVIVRTLDAGGDKPGRSQADVLPHGGQVAGSDHRIRRQAVHLGLVQQQEERPAAADAVVRVVQVELGLILPGGA